MEHTYKIFFSGQLKAGTRLDDAVQKMADMTGSEEEKIRTLLTSGKKTLIRKNLSEEQARQYHKKLTAIGLEIVVTKAAAAAAAPSGLQMERSETVREETPPPPPVQPEEEKASEQKPSPKPPPDPTPGPNPYAAPAADLSTPQEAVTGFLSEPRKLNAGRGWSWITGGFRLFMQAPLTWVGMVFVFSLILGALSLVPLLGSIASSILGIVFSGGLMIAAHSLAEGKGVQFNQLFGGFYQGRNQLILIGVLYLVGIIVVSIIALIPLGGSMLPLIFGYGGGDPAAMEQAFSRNIPLFMIGMLVALGLSIPLIMSVWMAPALAALTGMGGVEAMKMSLRASLRNIIPQLVYGLAIIIVGIILSIVMGVFVGITAAFAGDGGFFLAAVIPFLTMFILGVPAMIALVLSVYAAFRDIFCIEG